MPNATPYPPQGRYAERHRLGRRIAGTLTSALLTVPLTALLTTTPAQATYAPTAAPQASLHAATAPITTAHPASDGTHTSIATTPHLRSAITGGTHAANAPAAPRGRVALIGVPGLEWSDLDRTRTPNLWRLVGEGASASLSTRAVPPPDRGTTCPTAGWLTVSAGQRAGTPGKGCPPPPTPQPDQQTGQDGQTGQGATIPGWKALAAHQSETGYDAQLGTLGQLVTDNGGKVAAIGPGAALAAADKSGNIAKYAPTPDALGDPTPYNLIVLEAADLANAWLQQPPDEYGVPTSLTPAARQAAVTLADRQIGTLVERLPADTTVLLAGVSDVTPNAHLHVAIAAGPGPDGSPYPHGYLTATSTRQDALVTITDLTATTIQLLGLPAPRQVVGRPWQPGGSAPATASGTVTELADGDLASQVLREVRGPFFTVLVTLQLLFYALAALALRRRSTTRPNPSRHPAATATATKSERNAATTAPAALTAEHPEDTPTAEHPEDTATAEHPGDSAKAEKRHEKSATTATPSTTPMEDASTSKLLISIQVVAVVSGAIAVSTFLAQLVPWWTLPVPMLSVILTILAIAGLITAVAFGGPWRAHVLGPLATVAAITSLALLLDVMTGSSLQVNAVTGYEPVTGGRFYGFSNIAFAVYATGTVLGLAGVAQWLLGRGMSRAVVVTLCGLYGGFAVFADGWPSWGADFGGVPAFVVGLAVFLILLSGKRVSLLRLLIVGLIGAVLVGALSVFDWLRPDAQRTHLGNFVQQIIDGQAWTVIGRKFGAMIGVTVGNWSLTLLSLVALAFLFLVLARPSRWGASALGQAYRLAPTLRAGLFGALTCAFIGFLMNDSGIAIPAMALTVAVPLTLAACVRALQLAKPTPPAPQPGRAAPRRAEA
ncbi:hypothetical protein [Nonomuraea sp. KM90]|uniref:hypothetical protein n=1 Tax=Nonomuraea sp. KM90 TaxID=3457428 RepID=UPI003FCE3720